MCPGASAVCGAPMASPPHSVPLFLDQAPFPTVLPGGCPACDTRALQGAQLCLEDHYAAFPLPSGTAFNGSHTFPENAADTGGLTIALQVTHIPRANIYFYWQNKHPVPHFSFYHHPSCKHVVAKLSALHIATEQMAIWGSPSYPVDPSFLGYP